MKQISFDLLDRSNRSWHDDFLVIKFIQSKKQTNQDKLIQKI